MDACESTDNFFLWLVERNLSIQYNLHKEFKSGSAQPKRPLEFLTEKGSGQISRNSKIVSLHDLKSLVRHETPPLTHFCPSFFLFFRFLLGLLASCIIHIFAVKAARTRTVMSSIVGGVKSVASTSLFRWRWMMDVVFMTSVNRRLNPLIGFPSRFAFEKM
jgi:hypothetical protein